MKSNNNKKLVKLDDRVKQVIKTFDNIDIDRDNDIIRWEGH